MRGSALLLFLVTQTMMVVCMHAAGLTPPQIVIVMAMSIAGALSLMVFVSQGLTQQCNELRLQLWTLHEQSEQRRAALQELKKEVQQRQE